jgi:hypothetical protein
MLTGKISLRSKLDRATRDIISQLKAMKQILNHNYASGQSVQNKIDFLLGVIIGRILERCTYRLINIKICLTPEEFLWVNEFLLSKVDEFKKYIKECCTCKISSSVPILRSISPKQYY